MQPGWTLRLLQLFWPDPEPRLEFQKQVQQWKRPGYRRLGYFASGTYPWLCRNIHFLLYVALYWNLYYQVMKELPGGKDLSGLCAGFGLRIRYLDQTAIEGLTRWVLNPNLEYRS